MGTIVSYTIIGLLIVMVIYHSMRLYAQQRGNLTEVLTVAIPSVIAIAALLFPMLSSGETLSIIYPNVEEYIENNKQLTEENEKLQASIAKQEQEKQKLSEENTSLSEKNFAEISSLKMVLNGLDSEENGHNIAMINGDQYFNEAVVKTLVQDDLKYNEDENVLYIGKESDKVEKVRLEDASKILYSGESYEAFGMKDNDKNISVAGEEINAGFVLDSSKYAAKGSFVLMNLNQEYTTIEFDVGKVDKTGWGNTIEDGNMKIICDEKVTEQEKVSAEMPYTHYSFSVQDVKSLKISMLDSQSSFGFYNIVFTKK